MMHGFQEMEVFDDRSIEENEANFFAGGASVRRWESPGMPFGTHIF